MTRPNLSYLKSVILAVVAVPYGALTGLSGIGVGVFCLPGVRFLLGLRGVRASATSAAVVAASALAALLSYTQINAVNWAVVWAVLFSQIVGALLAVNFRRTRMFKESPGWLWAFLVIGFGAWFVFRHGSPLTSAQMPGSFDQHISVSTWAIIIVAGFSAGLLGNISGAAGVLLVPILLSVTHFTLLQVQGVSIATICIGAGLALFSHARANQVDSRSATWMGFGAFFGGLIGAWFATHAIHARSLVILDGSWVILAGITRLAPQSNGDAIETPVTQ